MIKFLAYYPLMRIDILDVVKETDHYVILENGWKGKKITESGVIVDTFNEAKALLLEKEERSLLSHLIASHRISENIKEIMDIKITDCKKSAW